MKELILFNCEGSVLKFKLDDRCVIGYYHNKSLFNVRFMDFLDFIEINDYSLRVDDDFNLCFNELKKSMGEDSLTSELKINSFIKEVKNNLLKLMMDEAIDWRTISDSKEKAKDIILNKYKSYLI